MTRRFRFASLILGCGLIAGCGGGYDPDFNSSAILPQNTIGCWDKRVVNIAPQPALDPPLDPFPGGNAARTATIQAAIDEWNRVLADPANKCPDNTKLSDRISFAVQGMAFAGSWAQQVCLDQGTAVYRNTWYDNDGKNGLSTAESNMNTPGWIQSPMIGSQVEALAMMHPRMAGIVFQEADILWFTHDGGCRKLPFLYDWTMPLNNQWFDYYSIVLHELGHVLGLDHLNGNGDVMQSIIIEGVRRSIGQAEIDTLKALYCGNACPVMGPGSGASG